MTKGKQSMKQINANSILLFSFFLSLYELVVNLSNDMYIPASTYLIEFFNTNSHIVQLTFTSWFAGSMIMNPVLGILSDNFCRKKILLISGLCFILASVYCAETTNIYLFIFARFIQGVTVTTIVVCGYALVHQIFDDKQAIIIIAWMSGILITAPMLGPLIGGYMIYLMNWQNIFLILAILAFFSLIGIKIFMPDNQSIDTTQKINWKNEFFDYKNIMTNVEFMLLTLISAMLFGGIIAWITASPFLLIGTYHFTPIEFGLAQIPIFGSYIVGTLVLKFALHYDTKETRIISIGIIIAAFIASLMFILCKISLGNVIALIILVSLYGFVFGMISAPLNRVTVKSVEFGLGKTMAIFDFLLGLCATISTVLINVNSVNILGLTYLTIGTFALLSCIFYTVSHLYLCCRGNHV